MKRLVIISLFLLCAPTVLAQSKKELAAKVAELTAENTALRNKLSDCNGHNTIVNNENAALKSEIGVLKTSNDQLRKSIEEKDGEIKQLKSVAPTSVKPAQTLSTSKPATATTASQEHRSKSTKTSTSVSAGRCQARTKAGHQCKRNAEPGRSYCWQH